MKRLRLLIITTFAMITSASLRGQPIELRTGFAAHAFDHLGSFSDQGETAAACGATVIYTTGVGVDGYQGLPRQGALLKEEKAESDYITGAKHHGIRIAIGYICATSIVGLNKFDTNWTSEFRAQFHSPISEWLQQDRNGKPLQSWYGGDYNPACMNNPDWREYEHFMVGEQLRAGCDGIFFDNPTVHKQGCYCQWCMKKFAEFIQEEEHVPKSDLPPKATLESVEAMRDWADKHPADFLKFRCTTARNFIADMREYARKFKSAALITANNSLNSPTDFYAQCRSYAYNIEEMSRTEDFVVVEDMATQSRILPNSQTIEYSPTYHLLHAICHDKPIVAVTVADADYTTPPNLARLALAEAAANDASSLFWPTWPEAQRSRMTTLIGPEVRFLQTNTNLFESARPRSDVVLFLPFREWLNTDRCRAGEIANELVRANVAFDTVCEEDFDTTIRGLSKHVEFAERARVLLSESASAFTTNELAAIERFKTSGGRFITADKPDWLSAVQSNIGIPSIRIEGSPNVRAFVWDKKNTTVVHLLNLNIQKLSSFEDRVTPATNLHLTLRYFHPKVHSVKALTADSGATAGPLEFAAAVEGGHGYCDVTIEIPRLDISTILVVE